MRKIADISKYQGDIDWGKAKDELDFCILRASCGMSLDTKYHNNIAGCTRYGVPFGVYHYVKAGDPEAAKAEARFFVECTQPPMTPPQFYIADIEYEAQTSQTTEGVCVAFLSELRKLGCEKIGLYINTKYKWAGAAIDMCDIVWFPHWGKNDGNIPEDKYKPRYYCDIWQYTSKGRVAGIKGNVDLNQLEGNKPLSYFTTRSTTEESEPERGDSLMLNNIQFAQYCLAVFAAKWVYWYGTCGYACTSSLYKRKKEQYPKYYTDARESGYKVDISAGKMCADCVGLIKSFFWKGGDLNGTNKYGANNCPDRSANGMYSLCKENGKIDTIPNIPGLVVWRSGHIGVYIGDGYTIEMKGFSYDCVKKKVSEGTWTNWGKLPSSMLLYGNGEVTIPTYKLGERTLEKGDEGKDVSELQTALVSLGYNLGTYGSSKNGVDGDFGSKTLAAVKALQQKSGLPVTGVFDTATYKALLAAQNQPSDIETEDGSELPDGGGNPAYVLVIEGEKDALKLVQLAYGGTLAAVDSVVIARE